MISIVIPDCNNDIYLERCINSIRRQSYKDIEILAVWKCKTDEKNIEGVYNYITDKDLKEIISVAVDKAKGRHLLFFSHFCVMSPTLLDELIKLTESDSNLLVGANELLVMESPVRCEEANTHVLFGKLFEKDLLQKANEQSLKKAYCAEHMVLANYIRNLAGYIRCKDANFYTTYIDKTTKTTQLYDSELFDNTLEFLDDFDEVERTQIENALIETVIVPEEKKLEVCNLICEKAKDNYRLMSHYVLDYYKTMYASFCRNVDKSAYDRVKEFLVNIEDRELLDVFLKKMGISEDMFSAMKHLNCHNYRFVVEDNTLFVAMRYPSGIENLYGLELAQFVVDKYEEGRLGAGTIIKCIEAWLKNKIKR